MTARGGVRDHEEGRVLSPFRDACLCPEMACPGLREQPSLIKLEVSLALQRVGADQGAELTWCFLIG